MSEMWGIMPKIDIDTVFEMIINENVFYRISAKPIDSDGNDGCFDIVFNISGIVRVSNDHTNLDLAIFKFHGKTLDGDTISGRLYYGTINQIVFNLK